KRAGGYVLVVGAAGEQQGRRQAPHPLRGGRKAERATDTTHDSPFFFKQKTAYEIGLGIPAEPLFRSMTRKVSAEVDLVHQQTQNQRYGSSHIGATAKDISNVVTDAASGVVDIFHGIDKAVADTWNNFWKDGKADGIGS